MGSNAVGDFDRSYPLATALLGHPDVSGVMRSSVRVRSGNIVRESCISVFVKKKKAVTELTPDQIIPDMVGGMATDVIECNPKLSLYSPTYRPLIGGISISGEGNETDGTMGGVFYDDVNSVACGLTNFHVISDAETPSQPTAYVIHPGANDGGFDEINRIGASTRYEVTEYGDAAIFTLSRSAAISQVTTHQVITSVREPQIGDNVAKVGRTTGLTQGEITGIGLVETDYTDYGYGVIYVNAFAFTPLVDPDEELVLGGDSGSLVYCTDDDAGVGLVFAHDVGPPFMGLACILSYVLEDLEISIFDPQKNELTATGSLNVGVATEHTATGSFSLVRGENTLATKLFAVDDWEKTYGADDFELWVQDNGYADTSAFLDAFAVETTEEWLATFNGEYETVADFLATQTIPTLRSAFSDNGITL